MKFAIVVFPGSNCDHDAYHAAKHVLGQEAEFVWHKETSLEGRRRRDPARRLLARRLPAHRRDRAVLADHGAPSRTFARSGGPVLGICNGFQILLEAGLLPGAMLRNRDLKFHCEHVCVRVEQTDTPFTLAATPGQVLQLPIAHGEGNYYATPDVLARARSRGRVMFRYCDARGEITDAANPNGVAQQHRRHLQRAAQRRRPDAASRARLRAGARQRRRAGDVRVGG